MLSEFEKFWQNVKGGGGPRQAANTGSCTIQMGTVGWDDAEEHAFLGSEAEDGHTLVRVQLYAGRDFSEPHKPEVAQGHKIVCNISSGLLRTPPKGSRCFVVVPAGMEDIVGAGVIIATVEPSRQDQLAKDRAILDYGPDVHVVIKAKSVSLSSHDNEFITVGTPRSGGTPGLIFQAKDGSGGVVQEGVVGWFVSQNQDAKTVIQMTPDKIEILNKAGSGVVLNTNFIATGSSAYVSSGAVYLGRAPTIASPALYGLTGVAGVASTSVYLSI